MITTISNSTAIHLSEAYLWGVIGEHLGVYMRAAPAGESRVSTEAWLALSGEPLALFNWAYIGPGPHANQRLREFLEVIGNRGVPALMFLPDAISRQLGTETETEPQQFGLQPGGVMPLMGLQLASVSNPLPTTSHEIIRVTTNAQLREMHRILSDAFELPIELISCVCTMRQLEGPGIESFLAMSNGIAISTVTTIRSGPLVGIWSMATDPGCQRLGAGYALLSHVIADHVQRGVTTFYLGATPAGLPLYQRLGFTTIVDAPFWITGPSAAH